MLQITNPKFVDVQFFVRSTFCKMEISYKYRHHYWQIVHNRAYFLQMGRGSVV